MKKVESQVHYAEKSKKKKQKRCKIRKSGTKSAVFFLNPSKSLADTET